MAKAKNKGVVLFIVLATLFIVIILANVILSIMSSQARLTHHEVSRIQAYYGSLAGINLAYYHLGAGDDLVNWPMPATKPGNRYRRFLCRNTTSDTPNTNCAGPNAIIDVNIPDSIQVVQIMVKDRTEDTCLEPSGSQVCIDATATYTYQP